MRTQALRKSRHPRRIKIIMGRWHTQLFTPGLSRAVQAPISRKVRMHWECRQQSMEIQEIIGRWHTELNLTSLGSWAYSSFNETDA